MPPSITFIFVLIVIACFIHACVSKRERMDIKRLPFIADITHGICPRCGDAGVMASKGFWSQFNCTCGYHIEAHFEDAR